MLKTFVHADEEELGITMCPPACVGVMATCSGPVGRTVHAHHPTMVEANRKAPIPLGLRPGLIVKDISHFYTYIHFQLSPCAAAPLCQSNTFPSFYFILSKQQCFCWAFLLMKTSTLAMVMRLFINFETLQKLSYLPFSCDMREIQRAVKMSLIFHCTPSDS